jgi:hypothetical protein
MVLASSTRTATARLGEIHDDKRGARRVCKNKKQKEEKRRESEDDLTL